MHGSQMYIYSVHVAHYIKRKEEGKEEMNKH